MVKRHEIIQRALVKLGSAKSGHYGHKGIPGHRGGSASSGRGGGFGTWSESNLKTLVTKMQDKYPDFYKRIEEHVGEEAAINDLHVPGSGLKESDVPDEITQLTQWDLRGRLEGSDHVTLYSGIYDHTKPPGTQISPSDWQDKFDREGFLPMRSFTSNPSKAYDFSEGSGSVVIATVPIKDIKVSHFISPVMQTAFAGTEFEFLISPSKDMLFNIRGSDRFQRTVTLYKDKGYGPQTLFGYVGARPGKRWTGD